MPSCWLDTYIQIPWLSTWNRNRKLSSSTQLFMEWVPGKHRDDFIFPYVSYGEKNHHASTITSPLYISGTADSPAVYFSHALDDGEASTRPPLPSSPPSAGHTCALHQLHRLRKHHTESGLHIIRCHLRVLTRGREVTMLQRTFTTNLSPCGNHLPDAVPVSVPPRSFSTGPCYQGDELAKVQHGRNHGRQEDQQRNVDEVKEFLPETFYTIMKETDRGEKAGLKLFLPPGPGYTRQHQVYQRTIRQIQARATGELLNFVSGFLSLTPRQPSRWRTTSLAAASVMRTKAKRRFYCRRTLKYDMSILVRNKMCFFAAAPMPCRYRSSLQTQKNLAYFNLEQIDPPEVRDMRILEIHYIDRTKAYDRWIWTPAIRRVRRSSTTERQDPRAGETMPLMTIWDGMAKYRKILTATSAQRNCCCLDTLINRN